MGAIKVRLGGTLLFAAGGRTEFEVETGPEATTIRQLLAQLGELYPELQPLLARGVAVAINGVVYREAFLTEIPDGSEVYLLPAMQGG